MTQEEKILLLKDICARIPYGLKASVRGSIEENITFDILSVATNFKVFVENRFIRVSHYEDIEVVRPYLRSFTQMTEQEEEQFEELTYGDYEDFETTTGRRMILATDSDTGYGSKYFSENISEVLEWLNAHHFDYRGLIEKGLALEAPEYMYDNKKN